MSETTLNSREVHVTVTTLKSEEVVEVYFALNVPMPSPQTPNIHVHEGGIVVEVDPFTLALHHLQEQLGKIQDIRKMRIRPEYIQVSFIATGNAVVQEMDARDAIQRFLGTLCNASVTFSVAEALPRKRRRRLTIPRIMFVVFILTLLALAVFV